MTLDTSIFGDAAADYYEVGIPVIPLRYHDKKPVLTKWQEHHDRLPNDDEQADWTERFRDNNIGLVLGEQSGLCMIDIDTTDEEKIKLILSVLPPSPWKRVGAKGMMLAYRFSGLRTFRIKDMAGNMLVEMLSSRTQVVVPPSIHPTTQLPYTENVPLLDVLDRVVELDGDVEQKLRTALKDVGVELSGGTRVQWTGTIPEGDRDNATTGIGGRLAHSVMVGERTLLEALAEAKDWGQEVPDQTCGFDWARKAQEKVIEFFLSDIEKRQPPTGWDQGLSDQMKDQLGISLRERKKFGDTEFGVSERLVDMFEGCFRWSNHLGWLEFDGCSWAEDERLGVQELAKLAVDYTLHDAYDLPEDDKTKKKAIGRALQLQNEKSVSGIIKLSKSESGGSIGQDMFDREPFDFNTISGTVDLKTGEIREHDRRNYISKISPVEFNPEAECPTWMKFLDKCFDGDQDTIGGLQRLLGYALTGLASERVIAIFQGDGSNGKSTLLNTVAHVFGSYAINAAPTTFMERKGESIPEDVARLANRRLVTTSEVSRNRRFDSERVKNFSGDEMVTARHLNQGSFDYRPKYLLVMATNFKPEIDGADPAMMSRILLFPFEARITEEEKKADPEFADRLLLEGPGILNWLVEGCRQWQAHGLMVPERVKAAVVDYGNEYDHVGQFLRERTVPVEGHRLTNQELRDCYFGWCCGDGGVKPETKLNDSHLGRELARRGFEEWRSSGKRGRTGLRLLKEVPERQRVEQPDGSWRLKKVSVV